MTILTQTISKLTHITILAGTLAFICACSPNLSERIGLQVKASANFDLAQLVPMPWDSVIIFAPYTGRAQICPALPASWTACQSELPEYIDESDHLMVFITDGKVSKYELVNRRSGDFKPAAINKPIPRAKAKFQGEVRQTAEKDYIHYEFNLMQP